MMKKLIITWLIATLLITNSHVTYAQELSDNVAYDLDIGGTQTFYLENEDGEIEIITIEAVLDNARAINNSYKVSYKASAWEAGFYIQIVAKQIVNAHSPFHEVLRGKIQNATLTLNSNTKATYAFQHKVTLYTYNTGVIVTLSETSIIVSKK